jgi:cobaltochelatase CobT
MPSRNPVAFLSYVRDDDTHDFGAVTTFRERLEGEVKVQSGQRFEIFQDRNDIRWGQFWQERITQSLSDVTFLIPIITPSFLVSPACRAECETFLRMEQTLGSNKLILPVYYVSCDAMERRGDSDPIAATLKKRNWTDWRSFRFLPYDNPKVRAALAELATNIKASMEELASIADAVQRPRPDPTIDDVATESAPPEATPIFQPLPSPPWSKDEDAQAAPPSDQFYWAYTLEFDETVPAAQLIGDAEPAVYLQNQLSREIASIKRSRKSFFKSLRATPQNDTAVTLLVDNSGSMRGRPITATAAWIVIISEWLDISGVRHEILGYTTRTWKGGQSRDKWIQDGKPGSPGRLNDLRHIVYKAFDEPASNVATNCAVMMRDGLLKENIDGEALLWACSRLQNEKVERKILFVLSDGAPVDDSTLSVNPGNFLEKHLMAAAGWIEQAKRVELRGIAIGHKPRYYTNAREADADEIGIPILEFVLKKST